MKNPELFNKTVAILVKAYQQETLQHQFCSCCAVGNLIGANMGLTPLVNSNEFAEGVIAKWDNAIHLGEVNESGYCGIAKEQIDATGYTIFQLADIERAFETSRNNFNGDRSYSANNTDLQFHSLMAVVDCLMQIHEATLEEATEAKQLFVKV